MINVKVDKGGIVLECEGNFETVCAEIGAIISGLHKNLNEVNSLLAMEFRRNVTRMVSDPSSPVWENQSIPNDPDGVRIVRKVTIQ